MSDLVDVWSMTGLLESRSMIYEEIRGLPVFDSTLHSSGDLISIVSDRYLQLGIPTPKPGETKIVGDSEDYVFLLHQPDREAKYRSTNQGFLLGTNMLSTSIRSFWQFPQEEVIARTPINSVLMVNIAPFSDTAFIYVPPLIEGNDDSRYQRFQDAAYLEEDFLTEMCNFSQKGMIGWWAGSSPSNGLMHFHLVADQINGLKIPFAKAVESGNYNYEEQYLRMGETNVNSLRFNDVGKVIQTVSLLAKYGYNSDLIFCSGDVFVFPVSPDTMSIFGVLGEELISVWPCRGTAERTGMLLRPPFVTLSEDHNHLVVNGNLRIQPRDFVGGYHKSINSLFDVRAIYQILDQL